MTAMLPQCAQPGLGSARRPVRDQALAERDRGAAYLAALCLAGPLMPPPAASAEGADSGPAPAIQPGQSSRSASPAAQARDWLSTLASLLAGLPVVAPLAQTEPVPSRGDAADDPAIWVHPGDAAASRILATDARRGLMVYDLQGRQLQDLPVGPLNNVDLRAGFSLEGHLVDLAVASNTERNSLHVFTIDRANGHVAELGEIDTPLAQAYGLCMYRSRAGAIHAIVNGEDGTFLQYRLQAREGGVAGTLERRFRLASRSEGCVADDRSGLLYVGEEEAGVWVLQAEADAPAAPSLVKAAGSVLQADIEGLALYHGEQSTYLLVSSQGNDSYAVFDAAPPYHLRGAFRIGPNTQRAIDGTSETDGLAATSADLGEPWHRGLLVVQDGSGNAPQGRQNYKYVPWSAVADALELP